MVGATKTSTGAGTNAPSAENVMRRVEMAIVTLKSLKKEPKFQ